MSLIDAAQVIERVGRARSARDVKSLVSELSGVSAVVLFDALFPVAVREQGESSGPVAMSAYALHALNPPCGLPIDDAVASLLPSWDVSIEEVPWYLAKQFGRDAVLAAVGRLRARQGDDAAMARLRTIEYWVGGRTPGA
ncbi:MAG TPA: hypothetical protein VEA69_07395 [Tepidisphaeraceae bacterium]|nr:hypothetical protein [Tepidisphaeraceae bacterium]